MNILIVDDHPIYVEGLRNLLGTWGYQDVEAAATGAGSVEVAEKRRPDLVLMDVGLPDISGIEACRRIRSMVPSATVVVLTSFADEETFFQAIQAGASGYLLKTLDGPDLRRCLTDLEAGRTPFSPGLESRLLQEFRRTSSGPDGSSMPKVRLTLRQREVLRAQALGKTYKEIGDELCISERTVRFHIEQIKLLLGLRSKQDLIEYSERNL